MLPPDPLHKHVPAAVKRRLGNRDRVTFLSLRDVLGALDGPGGVALEVASVSPLLLAPVLRAVRDLDALVGLCSPALAAPRDRHGFFESVCEAALSTGCNRPLFLSAPAVRIDAREPGRSAEEVLALADAGYTHVPLDVSELDLDESAAAVDLAATPLRELDYAVELIVDAGREAGAGALAAGLKLLSGPPDVISVRGGRGEGFGALAGDVAPVRPGFRDPGGEAEIGDALRQTLSQGARFLALRTPLVTAALGGIHYEARRAAREAGAASGWGALATATAEALEQVRGDDLDRIEARVYLETVALLELLQLRRKGAAVRHALVG